MKSRHLLLSTACLLAGSMLTLLPTPTTFAEAGPTRAGADLIKPKVPQKVVAFDLNQVQLLDSAFKNAQDIDQKGLMDENLDNMLYPFRREAKLPNPGRGSDSLNYTATGHIMGHWMSAAAFVVRNTSDQELKKKADLAVAELAKCQEARGDGFCGGFPTEKIFVPRPAGAPPAGTTQPAAAGAPGATRPANQNAGVPWYCLHKIYAGLLDLYVLTDNKQALDVLKKTADWAIKYTDNLSDEQMQQMLNTEHGGINEVFANLYAVTGEEKYLKLSERFHHKRVLDPFIENRDILDGLHANTQFPKFIGMARLYELTGNPDDNKIATNFWNVVVHERSFVTGGNSTGEGFRPKATLSTSVNRSTSETCNEFNMLRLTRILFQQDPKPEYGDFFERALYNQILSSRNPDTGGQLYFQELMTGQMKNRWLMVNQATQCCFGSGMESNAKYADGIYFHSTDNNALYVNLFVPSVLNWKDKGVSVKQETHYPDEGKTKLTFTCDKPTDLTINLRHPYWAAEGFAISVNGERQATGTPASFVPVKRSWKSGDTIEVTMPMSFRMEGFKDNPKRAAVMYGPLVMAAITEPNNRTSCIVTEQTPQQSLATLKPVAGKSLEFTAPSNIFRTADSPTAATITFKPLLRMIDESYAVYWDQMTATEFTNRPPPATEPARGRRGGGGAGGAGGAGAGGAGARGAGAGGGAQNQ